MGSQDRVGRVMVLVVICLCGFAKSAPSQDCPELVGRWPYGPSYAVAVSGTYTYFGSGPTVLIVDIFDPAAPQVVGEVNLPGVIKDVAVSGSYAYVANSEGGGLRVIDISTPTDPFEVGFVDTPGLALGVDVSGSYAYVAADRNGLRVIDVSTTTSPNEVAFVDTPGVARAVGVSGSYAYVAAGEDGLRVLDVSDPVNPLEVGFADTPGGAVDVAVSGTWAYVADSGRGVRIIDVSDPATPTELGFHDFGLPGSNGTSGVAVSGNYSFVPFCFYDEQVLHRVSSLRVIDISRPTAPVEVGNFERGGCETGIGGVTSSEGLIFWAAGDLGVEIFDASACDWVRAPRTLTGRRSPTP